jgi:hypothetical protein
MQTTNQSATMASLIELCEMTDEANRWIKYYLCVGRLEDAEAFAEILSKLCQLRATLLLRLAKRRGATRIPLASKRVN